MEELRGNLSQRLRSYFPDYQWNTIADAILEGTMGQVLVDDGQNPQVAVLSLPAYKLFILGGDPQHKAAGDFLMSLPGFSTLMIGKSGWVDRLEEVQPGKTARVKRYAFSSESLDPEKLMEIRASLPEAYTLEKISPARARQIASEKNEVTEDSFFGFSSADDFLARGIGFCTLAGDELACAATTAAVCSKGAEVQINTHRKYRGRGLASATGAALILACLEQGLDPNWDAATEISAGLARKLGYTPRGEYDTYIYTGSRFLIGLRNFLRRLRGKEI